MGAVLNAASIEHRTRAKRVEDPMVRHSSFRLLIAGGGVAVERLRAPEGAEVRG
jgi:hypothetical protein